MDPKALSHLDPRARETYDRIMGTAGPTDPAAQTTPPLTDLVGQPQGPQMPAMDTIQSTGTPSVPEVSSPVAPTDFSADGLSTPMQNTPPPSVFSTDSPAQPITPVPMDTMQTPQSETPNIDPIAPLTPTTPAGDASFFTNPVPNSTEPALQAADIPPIAPIETPADTSMVTDVPTTQTPVTPYTPAGPTDVTQQEQAQPSFTQPLTNPADAVQAATKETPPIMKVLYIVGAVIFFAVYTIFWVKVFNLPFLF